MQYSDRDKDAITLVLTLLQQEPFVKLSTGRLSTDKYPRAVITVIVKGREETMIITYGTEVDTIFNVDFMGKDFLMKNYEYSMIFEPNIENFVVDDEDEKPKNKPKKKVKNIVRDIFVVIDPESSPQPFYIKSIGVVWNKREGAIVLLEQFRNPTLVLSTKDKRLIQEMFKDVRIPVMSQIHMQLDKRVETIVDEMRKDYPEVEDDASDDEPAEKPKAKEAVKPSKTDKPKKKEKEEKKGRESLLDILPQFKRGEQNKEHTPKEDDEYIYVVNATYRNMDSRNRHITTDYEKHKKVFERECKYPLPFCLAIKSQKVRDGDDFSKAVLLAEFKVPQAKEKWVCSSCDMENDEDREECAACTLKKGGKALTKEESQVKALIERFHAFLKKPRDESEEVMTWFIKSEDGDVNTKVRGTKRQAVRHLLKKHGEEWLHDSVLASLEHSAVMEQILDHFVSDPFISPADK